MHVRTIKNCKTTDQFVDLFWIVGGPATQMISDVSVTKKSRWFVRFAFFLHVASLRSANPLSVLSAKAWEWIVGRLLARLLQFEYSNCWDGVHFQPRRGFGKASYMSKQIHSTGFWDVSWIVQVQPKLAREPMPTFRQLLSSWRHFS